MNWDVIAATAEVVAATAVVVSLVYLGVQVRHGNLAQTRETYRGCTTEVNRVLFTPMTDPETMALLQKGSQNFESLNHREQGVINAIWAPLFMLCAEIFTARNQGHMDPQQSLQLDVMISTFLQMPGTAAWWQHVKPFFAPDYLAHVEALLSSPDCPPPLHEMLPWYMPDDLAGESV